MKASPLTLSQRKFLALSNAGRHALLAVLADMGLAGEVPPETIWARYAVMHAWVSLDRYNPPAWLAPGEALADLAAFHRLRAQKGEPLEPVDVVPTWAPRLAVDVVLDGVRSPYNVGSILRLMDNFGLASLIHADPDLRLEHPRLVKAARGAQAWIPVRYTPHLPDLLARCAHPVVAVEEGAGALPLGAWDPPARACLVLGNETYGISAHVRGLCGQTVCVPTYGFKKSMNVSHAFAVVAQRMVEKHAG